MDESPDEGRDSTWPLEEEFPLSLITTYPVRELDPAELLCWVDVICCPYELLDETEVGKH